MTSAYAMPALSQAAWVMVSWLLLRIASIFITARRGPEICGSVCAGRPIRVGLSADGQQGGESEVRQGSPGVVNYCRKWEAGQLLLRVLNLTSLITGASLCTH